MTLEDAIRHAEDVARRKCDACGDEHRQLAEWLKELVALRLRLTGREARYEYICEEKIPKKGWLPVDDFSWYDLGAARQHLTNMNCQFKTRIVRREVGEWEVVKE